ncbi:MAG: NADH-quinone oxidoreductase subunit N [Bryobacterales bacterium]|nr:NADH-quinone oxidoreductase subunit N [Bryobacterales bacterium]
MNLSQFYTATEHFALLPCLLLALFGCGLLIVDFFLDVAQKTRLVWIVLLAEAFTASALYRQHVFLAAQPGGSLTAFGGALTIDGLAVFFNWIFVATVVLIALISYCYLAIEREHHGEYYGLMLLAQSGMFLLAAATDLVTIFVGLELMAVSFYVMVGFLRSDRRSNEAAMKYLILGAFSSGFLAYGFSILYGLSGSTRLRDITAALSQRDPWDPVFFLGLATTAVGLLFKVAAVPFHMWAPDTYEGAPTTVTAFLSVGSKAASFALLLRLFQGPFATSRVVWEPLLVAVAILSLTVGNLAAVTQSNIKRLLAYSSISHAGYMLLGLIAGNQRGMQAIAVYALVYTFMTIGAFLVVVALRRKDLLGEDIEDLNGLMHKSPGYAVLMLIFMLSLAGLPPTAGFIGKYYIFLSLIETQHYLLAAVAAIYVAVAIFYYFRIVRSMFLSDAEDRGPLSSSWGMRVALVLSGALTLIIGIMPEPFIALARTSVLR